MKKVNFQVNIWVAALGLFVLVQLGFWASYLFTESAVPLLLFAAMSVVMGVFFPLGLYAVIRFVPEAKRVRWGIPIMSVVILIDLALLTVEIVQGAVQTRTVLTIPLHIAVLASLWWLKHRHETQSREADN